MAAPPRETLLAIVGRPNVGKSTLYNRLVGGRPALVLDTPGLTRDRRYGEFEYYGHHFRVVDTGGLDMEAEQDVVGAGIHRQAHLAIEECDAVLFVLDATAGITPIDHDLATMLRKSGKPVILAANKVDGPKRDHLINDLYALSMGEVYPISAAHGRGCDDLIDNIVELLELPKPVHPTEDDEEDDDYDDEDRILRVAFVGKPNAGKSSMVNRLLGVERTLVHHEPGTTTDPVDTEFEFGGRTYCLVDTAGIRRRARIEVQQEKVSVSMALSQIERADVVVLVIDAELGPSQQDARLAGAVEDKGRALVVALNKSDLLGGRGGAKAVREQVIDELRFWSHAPSKLVSAMRGDGVVELMKEVDKVAAEHVKRIPTAELNKFFAEVCEVYPPPVWKGKTVRIHYITQGGIRPPTFLFWANAPKNVSPSYKRFMVNQLRKRYGFNGTPIRTLFKDKKKVRLAKKSNKSGKRHRKRR